MKIIPKGQDGLKINLNNGSILEYKNGKWYRNGKQFTDYVLSKYKYYDPKKKSYMTLNKDGTIIPYTPYLNRLQDEYFNKKADLYQKSENQRFKPSNKIITLKTRGVMNLADIPINMLDSIARNTGRSRTNIKTNLGLIGKESTFGGRSKALGLTWNSSSIRPYDLVNNHAYFVTPETDYAEAIGNNIVAYGTKFGNWSIQSLIDAEKNVKYAYEHSLIKPRTKHYHDNVLADAFIRYANNPNKYNPGQSNYTQMVTNIGNEVWSDPQIQNWWNTSGKKYYNIGLKE